MTKLYFIYMPAGHIDWISRGTSLAMCSTHEDMLHYVTIYQTDRGIPKWLPSAQVEGPIEVRCE